MIKMVESSKHGTEKRIVFEKVLFIKYKYLLLDQN